MEPVFKSVDERSARMRSDSVKNMSAYADQNHAPSLAAARLEFEKLVWTVTIIYIYDKEWNVSVRYVFQTVYKFNK